MATVVRFYSAFAIVLLVNAVAAAEVPTAPPPHPALEEVVKEYRRLDLALPPQDAELVRILLKVRADDLDGELRASYLIGFKLAPSVPGRDPRYMIGYGSKWGHEWFDPAKVKPVEPNPDALTSVHLNGEEFLVFAVQCELRGWHDLAHAAYARARERFTFISSINHDPEPSVIVELRWLSLWSWEGRLTQPGTDRKEILKRLKEKFAEEPSFRSPQYEYVLRCLELTVTTPKAKPGTGAALIDDLTEYWIDRDDPSNATGQEPYWKLVERGFDAVPALIEHLSDDRISRAYSSGAWNNFRDYRLTVGHLCSRLLYDLSARTIGGDYWALRGDRIDPKKAREWFTTAQKVGEEKWLLDYAIPEGDPGPIVNESGRPEGLIVRVIGAKYPARLPAIYRAMLKKKPSLFHDDYVKEILASKLPRDQKVALFEEGAGHDDMDHRVFALKGLAGVDQKSLGKYLLLTLKQIPARLEMKTPWVPNPSQLLPLLARADDRDCWDTLATVAKHVPCELRLDIIHAFDPMTAPDEHDLIRKERLRFLVQFLGDRSTVPDDVEDWNGVEVRDHAAIQLAGLLRIPVERLSDPWYVVQHDSSLGPVSRYLLREAVRQIAARDLR